MIVYKKALLRRIIYFLWDKKNPVKLQNCIYTGGNTLARKDVPCSFFAPMIIRAGGVY